MKLGAMQRGMGKGAAALDHTSIAIVDGEKYDNQVMGRLSLILCGRIFLHLSITIRRFLHSPRPNVHKISPLPAALFIRNLDIEKTPRPVRMRRGLAQAHERVGTPVPVCLEQPIRPFGTHEADRLAPRERLNGPEGNDIVGRGLPAIPVKRPLVLHLEHGGIPFIRTAAGAEHAPDVAEIANVARERVVVEVLHVVVAVVDGDVAGEHHRFVVADIRVRGQVVDEILHVPPDGYIILVRRVGEERETRRHGECGEAEKWQEQSQARVGGFRHTLCRGFLLLPLHQGVVEVMTG